MPFQSNWDPSRTCRRSSRSRTGRNTSSASRPTRREPSASRSRARSPSRGRKERTCSSAPSPRTRLRSRPSSAAPAFGSPTPTYEWAAAVAGVVSYYGNIDPARPFQTLTLKGVMAPKQEDRFTLQENNLLLFDGISTHLVEAGGVVHVQRLITTYTVNAQGAEDISYLDVNTPLTRQSANQAALVSLVRRTAIIETARLAPTVDFAYSQEAFDHRDAIGDLLDAEMDAASTTGDDSMFTAFRSLRAAVVKDLNGRAPKLARLIEVTANVTEPALVTAYRLYGDASRGDEIAARNRLRHPGFVPGGVGLEVLTGRGGGNV
ncbi:MAG: phage tail sheath subtilisin-like domain-containing protein [Alphaproteobacteria bacterium]|nr:phage tail sheath subtilisin-like domain-containing protein [Alphaproteobacteria bacterium]